MKNSRVPCESRKAIRKRDREISKGDRKEKNTKTPKQRGEPANVGTRSMAENSEKNQLNHSCSTVSLPSSYLFSG